MKKGGNILQFKQKMSTVIFTKFNLNSMHTEMFKWVLRKLSFVHNFELHAF